MPQICRFPGVNSVTNIESNDGFMPALLLEIVDWLEIFLTNNQETDPRLFPMRRACRVRIR